MKLRKEPGVRKPRSRYVSEIGGRGPGRPPIDDPRSVRREVRLLPEEAKAHDDARGDEPWSSWIRSAAARDIARGSTS